MPWGMQVSQKAWDFELRHILIAERVVLYKPYHIAQSKAQHLLDTLAATGWVRCKESDYVDALREETEE